MPGKKLDFYLGFLERGRPAFAAQEAQAPDPLAPCTSCGYPTSSEMCGVCRIKAALREE